MSFSKKNFKGQEHKELHGLKGNVLESLDVRKSGKLLIQKAFLFYSFYFIFKKVLILDGL